MEDLAKINKQGNLYILQCTVIFILLKIVGELGAAHFGMSELLGNPIQVSTIFCLLTGIIIGVAWKWVAKTNEEMLTTFYNATNAFRMLLALATLTVCYFVFGEENIKVFVIVFLVFYLVAIAHHAVYFAHITNKK